jgi:phage regulator Rha-like protein
MPIDTLKAAKRLQEDDTFSPEQAERIAEILSDLDVASATTEDLNELEERLDTRFQELEERLDTRFQHAADDRESREERLTQRIELSERAVLHVHSICQSPVKAL